MAKKKKDKNELVTGTVATNRKARHDYHILESLEAGMVLTGTEVKSLRQGRASLAEGYAYIDRGEVWVDNLHIPEYTQGTWNNHASRRKRKLLMHRAEINKLEGKLREKGVTLIPMKLYFSDGRAKLEVGLAKGKQDHDKRQTLREKQDNREAARAMSARFKRRG